jgi:coatomer subunit beta'
VAVVSDDSYYILKFDRDAYNSKIEEGVEITDEGVEEAFDVVAEISDSVKTAKWIGDCFIYTTAGNRLNYFVGNESYTISPSDTSMFILGYIPAHNRVYLADKDMNIFGYSLSLSVVEYQTAVLRGDMDSAAEILPTLPKEQLNKVARFLEGRDLKELALQVTTDPDHKFDLSLQLDDLDTAVNIARSVLEPESETKWKAIGDRALTVWRFDLAREAFEKAGDLSALMLLLLSTGDREGLQKLAATAEQKGANNLAFATLFQLGDAKSCVDLLVKTNRAPEAALFARTYAPSEVPRVVDIWRGELRTKNKGKIAGSIVHPSEHAELFEEGWEEALAREAGGPVDVNGDSDISPNESEDT